MTEKFKRRVAGGLLPIDGSGEDNRYGTRHDVLASTPIGEDPSVVASSRDVG